MAGAIATNRRRGGSRIANGDNRDQPMIGREIIRVNSVASTMDEIADLANAGVVEGAVVITEEQTAGRGTGDHRPLEWTAGAVHFRELLGRAGHHLCDGEQVTTDV